MAEVIFTTVAAMFFVIGVYTTVREVWSLIFGDDEDEKPP